MNDNKEYGVELELKTNKFRNSLRNIAETVRQTTDKMKQNLSTGFYMDRTQAEEGIKQSTELIEEYKNSIIDFYKEYGYATRPGTSSKGFTIDAKQLAQVQSYKNEINGLRQTIALTQQDLQTLDNSRMAALGQAARYLVDKINSAWASIKRFGRDGASDVDKVNDEMKETVSLSDRISVGMNNMGNNINKSFNKGIASVKRFALSLFGVQTVWRVVSKAASSYLSYDTELSDRIAANWIALGSVLEPILTWITDLLRQVVGYINVFVKALTGVDYIARANAKVEKSTKKTTKAVKELNKELTSLDEITNLTFDEQNNNLDEDLPTNPLEGFNDMKLDPNIVKFIEGVANKLKDLWNWLKENKDMLIEVGKVALVAFAGWKVGSAIASIASLLGVAGGSTGLWGLIGAFAALDVYLGVKLVDTVNELFDTLDRKSEEERNLIEQTTGKWQHYAEVISDTNGDENEKLRILGDIEAFYSSYLNQLKEGVGYTTEQKQQIEEYAKKIEEISGKKFTTELETQYDIYPTSRTNSFLDRIERTSSILGGGVASLFHTGKIPGFASGNVAYGPTLGQFGEYSGAATNPEITSPQDIMEDTLYSALARALPLINNGGQQGDIVLEINGREFARATYDDFEYESNRLGKNTSIRRY